jgi:hypothetical protein
MTIMAAEAGVSAFEGESAAATSAGRTATRRPRTQRRAAPAPAAQAPSRPERSGGQRQPRGGQARGGFPGGGRATGSNYHGVILAEWAVGFVLVAAIPFSKPNQTGVSPYAGKDLVQLGTLTVLYWILAIVAATGRTQARFAAWFGGLILLAVGLAEAAAIATAVKEWLPGGTTTPTPAAPAGNPSTVNPGSSEPATGISRPPAQAPGNGLT